MRCLVQRARRHLPRDLPAVGDCGARGDSATADAVSTRLAPIWALFATYGSFRVTAALATLSGLLPADAVYAPVRPMSGAARREVGDALRAVGPLA